MLSATPGTFTLTDIGSPGLPGLASYNAPANSVAVSSYGSGLSTTSDQLTMVNESFAGSGSAVANVGAVSNTGAGAEAGLMLRDSSSATSAYAAVTVNATGQISIDYRAADGGTEAVLNGPTITAGSSVWLALSETQTNGVNSTIAFTGSYSTNGVTFTAINSTPLDVTFSSGINLAGLEVASGGGSYNTTTFNGFSVIPSTVTAQDIGGPGVAGGTLYSPVQNEWGVTGSGSDIYNSSDQFQFASQAFTGDGGVTARITSMTNTNAFAKTGVMLRDTNAANSAFVDLVYTNTLGLQLLYRSSAGAAVQQSGLNVSVTGTPYLRLWRQGNVYSAYYSMDGVNWSQVGAQITVGFSSANNLAGLVECSHNNSAADTATFTNFSVTNAPLMNQDIGNPGIAGSGSYNSATGVWTLSGSGSDIWNTSDQFTMVGQNFIGSGTVIARVASMQNADAFAKTGIMIRDGNGANAAFVDVVYTNTLGLQFLYRASAGAYAQQNGASTAVTGPFYLKLVNSGGNFSAYYSLDGTNYTQIGATQTVNFINPVSVAGLVVCSHNNADVNTSTFDTVSVTPAAALPAGYADGDIGVPPYYGAAAYNSTTNTWTVAGSGSDIWNAQDQFNFVSSAQTGDGQISAEVLSQTYTDPWAKAGVMMRANSAADSPFVDIVVTPGNGVAMNWRDGSGNLYNYNTPSSYTAPLYVMLQRQGNVFTGFLSTDNVHWTAINSVTIAMTDPIMTGLVASSHNQGAVSAATFGSVATGPVTAVTSIPLAPTIAFQQAISPTDIYLSWINRDTPLTAATGYQLQMSTDGGSTYSTIATIAAGQGSAWVQNLNPLSTYYFRVIANGANGASPPGALAAAVTTPAASGAQQEYLVSVGGAFAGDAGLTPTITGLDPQPGDGQWVLADSPVAAILQQLSGTILDAGLVIPFVAPTIATTNSNVTTGPGSSPYFQIVPLGSGNTNQYVIQVEIDPYASGVDGEPGIDRDYDDGNIIINVSSVPGGQTPVGSQIILTAAAKSPTEVGLDWAMNSTVGVAGYNVLESTDGTNFTTAAVINDPNLTAFNVAGLSPGVAYYFEIQTVVAAGGSGSPVTSNIATTTTPTGSSSGTFPPAPVLNLQETYLSPTDVQASWSPGNDYQPVDGYIVQLVNVGTGGSSTPRTPLMYLPPNVTTYGFWNLDGPNGSAVTQFLVAAYNGAGVSPFSGFDFVQPAPQPIQTPVLSAEPISLKQALLYWTQASNSPASNADTYYIYTSTDDKTFTQVQNLSGTAAGVPGWQTSAVLDQNLSPFTNEWYYVEAISPGESAQSATVEIPASYIAAIPTTPVINATAVSSTEIDVQVAPDPFPTSPYITNVHIELEMSTTGTGNWQVVYDVNPLSGFIVPPAQATPGSVPLNSSQTSIPDAIAVTGLQPGTTYYFRARYLYDIVPLYPQGTLVPLDTQASSGFDAYGAEATVAAPPAGAPGEGATPWSGTVTAQTYSPAFTAAGEPNDPSTPGAGYYQVTLYPQQGGDYSSADKLFVSGGLTINNPSSSSGGVLVSQWVYAGSATAALYQVVSGMFNVTGGPGDLGGAAMGTATFPSDAFITSPLDPSSTDGQFSTTIKADFTAEQEWDDMQWQATMQKGTVGLQIDGNNNDGVAAPDGSLAEFIDSHTAPGKIVTTNTNDLNGDGVPDFAEGYTGLTFNGAAPTPSTAPAAGVSFVPMNIVLPVTTNLANTSLELQYSGSDPLGVTVSGSGTSASPYVYTPATGDLRIWDKSAGVTRNGAGITSGGDYITPGTSFNASSLNFVKQADGSYLVTVYVEAVAASPAGADPITITVNPGFVPFAETDTVFVTAISVGVTPKFTDGTAGTLATSLKNVSNAGGWVLLNSNDYNYDLTSSNNLIPAKSQTGAVAGDAALAPLQLNISGLTNVGIWTFVVTSGLRLWQNNDRSGAITTFINTALPTTTYVEGIADSTSQGDQTITLKWQDTAAGTPVIIDQIKETVFEIQGPQNVPGNSGYTYTIQAPVATESSGWNAVGGGVTLPSSGPAPSVTVGWQQGPEIGQVEYSPTAGFQGQWNVNVVDVFAGAGSVGEPAGKASGGYEPAVQTGEPVNGGSIAVTDAGAPANVTFADTVAVDGTGPQGNWGISQLTIGFIQNFGWSQETGTYADGTVRNSINNNTLFMDPLPADPKTNTAASAPPWYDSNDPVAAKLSGQIWHPTAAGLGDFATYDLPGGAVPSTSNDLKGGSPLTKATLSYYAEMYLAVVSSDTSNGANTDYFSVAHVTYDMNYSFTLNNSIFTMAAAQAVTGPGVFTPDHAENIVAVTTGTTATEATNADSWTNLQP